MKKKIKSNFFISSYSIDYIKKNLNWNVLVRVFDKTSICLTFSVEVNNCALMQSVLRQKAHNFLQYNLKPVKIEKKTTLYQQWKGKIFIRKIIKSKNLVRLKVGLLFSFFFFFYWHQFPFVFFNFFLFTWWCGRKRICSSRLFIHLVIVCNKS